MYRALLDVEHFIDFLILADIKSLRSLTMHRLEVKHGESCCRLWTALCLQACGVYKCAQGFKHVKTGTPN